MNKSIALFALTIASSAHAELALLETPFWKGYYLSEQTVYFRPDDQKNLAAACKSYHANIFTDVSLIDKKEHDERRHVGKTSWDMWYANAKFAMKIDATEEAVKKSFAEAQRLAPPLTDNRSWNTVQFEKMENLLGSRSPFRVIADAQSLSTLSSKVGLEPLPIYVEGGIEHPVLRFAGFDTACDLLEGHAHLEYDDNVRLVLSQDSVSRLHPFFEALGRSSLEVLNHHASPRSTAALLGLRLGRLIEQSSIVPDNQVESLIGNLVDSFFDEALKPAAMWSKELYGEAFGLELPDQASASILIYVKVANE